MSKYAWIKEHRRLYKIENMCRVLQVSRSGYYKWLKQSTLPENPKRLELRTNIIAIHTANRGVYGSPRVFEALKARGIHCNHKTVARIMQREGLRAKQHKKFRATTNSKHDMPIADNTLDRKFEVAGPNKVWVTDITYVWTDEGWLYLVVFIDLWSRKIVGWSMSDRMKTEFVTDAFQMACRRRKPKLNELLVHSDRGSQYASDLFRKDLSEYSCNQSMSRKGNCWDNAVSESFFGTIKKEMIYLERFKTRESARRAIFEYIEIFYNRIRLHSTINFLSPEDFEQKMETAA